MWCKSSYSWRKPLRSMSNGNCAEVTVTDDGIRVRDSKNPALELTFTSDTWTQFINGVRDGC